MLFDRVWKRLAFTGIFSIAILLCASLCNAGDNFRVQQASGFAAGSGAKFSETLENSRREIAIYWFGHELPTWSRPAVVNANFARLGAGGETKFVFSQGQVYDWKMDVRGEADELNESVLPHEATHTVLASVLRRPLPRMLDEGAATFSESEHEHQLQRERVRQLVVDKRFVHFDQLIDMKEYHQVGDISALYAEGFAIVEYLVDRSGPDRFIEFLKDKRPPSQKVKEFYSFNTVRDLEAAWWVWFQDKATHGGHDCESFGCTAPHNGRIAFYNPDRARLYNNANLDQQKLRPGQPVLYIFCTPNCAPCQKIHADYDSNRSGLRDWLCARFNVQFVDVTVSYTNARLAHAEGVRFVPAFRLSNHRIRLNQYDGPEKLMAFLTKFGKPTAAPSAGTGPVAQPAEGLPASPPADENLVPPPQDAHVPPPTPTQLIPGPAGATAEEVETILTSRLGKHKTEIASMLSEHKGEVGKVLVDHRADVGKLMEDALSGNRDALRADAKESGLAIGKDLLTTLEPTLKEKFAANAPAAAKDVAKDLFALLGPEIGALAPGLFATATGVGAPLGIVMLLGHFLQRRTAKKGTDALHMQLGGIEDFLGRLHAPRTSGVSGSRRDADESGQAPTSGRVQIDQAPQPNPGETAAPQPEPGFQVTVQQPPRDRTKFVQVPVADPLAKHLNEMLDREVELNPAFAAIVERARHNAGFALRSSKVMQPTAPFSQP